MATLIAILVGGCSFLLLMIGIAIGWWIISGKPAADARAMKSKFSSLGTIAGKSREEIERVVGGPSSWAAIGDGRTSYSWHMQKYYVTLIFKDDICEGVSSEISV